MLSLCRTLFSGKLRLPLLVFLMAMISSQLDAQQSNHVVAVVNADPITNKALGEACLMRYGNDVLDSMINRHLILQACKQNGIEVTSNEVREEIIRISAKFGLTVESYLQLLQEERDIPPDQYSREIVWPMLALRRLVADKVEPTDEEFNQAFLSQFGEAVKCRLIMTADRQKAESIQKQASANPEQFGSLAKAHSEDEASASVGGLIPPIRRYTGDSRLEEAAFGLQDGQVSPVLQLGDQWIFLQAVRRIPASTPSPQAMPSIKEQIHDRIRDQKMRGAAGELFTRLQKQAQVTKVLGDEVASQQNPGVAAIVNGQQVTIAAVTQECVKRHGAEVLEGEINRKLLNQALNKSKQTVTAADIDAEIQRASKSYGYVRNDGSADVDAWIESVTSDGNTTKEIYIHDAVWPSVALKKLVQDEITVSEEDLQRGFEAAFGPRVEVLAIVLSDQRSAQKVWEMARDNPTDQFFGQLAEQYSVEPVSSSNSGKVPPIRKYGGQPAIEREAFAMKAGDLSGIVATGDQYIIMRCQGFTEPIVTDINAVRDELISDLTEKKTSLAMSEEFDRLKDSAEIDNFLAAAKATDRVATSPPAASQPATRQ
tara:strand:- start:146737 stop:148533 length:1797 start_codon:yes stop_codon:yes gene_type:complete